MLTPSSNTPGSPIFEKMVPNTAGELKEFLLELCRGESSKIQFSLSQHNTKYVLLKTELTRVMRGNANRQLTPEEVTMAISARDMLLQEIADEKAAQSSKKNAPSMDPIVESTIGYCWKRITVAAEPKTA